jgi:hypothetical protein
VVVLDVELLQCQGAEGEDAGAEGGVGGFAEVREVHGTVEVESA